MDDDEDEDLQMELEEDEGTSNASGTFFKKIFLLFYNSCLQR